jgi:predicted nucleotidyltransferase
LIDLQFILLMTATYQPALEEATRRLAEVFRPEQIWLFGSHAWGKPTEHSDMDLMVVLSDSDEQPIRRMQRAQRCLSGLGVATDVLVKTRREVDRYRHLRSTLSHKIYSEGRLVYG